MTAIRRVVVLTALTMAVTIGSSIPASATFGDSASLSTAVATGTVAAPADVSVAVTYCHPVHSFGVTVSWPSSTTTRGVIGYRVTAHLSNGASAVMAETDAATRSISTSADRSYLQFEPRVTVTTLTSYGWTKQSMPSAVISC